MLKGDESYRWIEELIDLITSVSGGSESVRGDLLAGVVIAREEASA